MARVRADAGNALSEVDAVDLAVSLIPLKADKWQGADVDALAAAVRLQHRQPEIQSLGGRGLEAIAVAVALRGDVAREGVPAVRPPEAGAAVVVERQVLLGQRLAAEGLDGEVAVEDVVRLR